MSQQKNNHFSRKIIAVLEIIATFARDYQINPIGEVLEWLKRHAWKACKPLKGFTSSNLVLSAKIPYRAFCEGFFVKSVPKNVPKIRFRGSPSLDLLQGSRSRCEADRSASPGLLIFPAPTTTRSSISAGLSRQSPKIVF